MAAVLDPHVRNLDRGDTWRALTTLPEKFALHGSDTYFRESWAVAVDSLGPATLPALQRLAVLTVRPELVLARRIETCLRFMAEHGFVAVHAERFAYSRQMARDVWRYQWNVATLDRIAVSDVIHRRAPVMTVFFIDTTTPLNIPAAARLTTLKGSAFPAARQGFHLRTVLDAPNRVLVQVHCPDEPLDIVRELGVVFDRETLARVFARLRRAMDPVSGVDLGADVEKLYAAAEQRCLDVDSAVATVRADLVDAKRAASRARTHAAGRAGAALDAALAGGHLRWRGWARDLLRCGIDPESWHCALVASHYIQHDIPGARCLITETGRRRWIAGEGVMVDA